MIKATAVFENAMEASVSERESYSRGQEQTQGEWSRVEETRPLPARRPVAAAE